MLREQCRRVQPFNGKIQPCLIADSIWLLEQHRTVCLVKPQTIYFRDRRQSSVSDCYRVARVA